MKVEYSVWQQIFQNWKKAIQSLEYQSISTDIYLFLIKQSAVKVNQAHFFLKECCLNIN